MSYFTYEAEDRGLKLEQMEWDNVWWEQTSDHTKPRILYIGDSVSCEIRRIATKCSDEKLLFDGFGTSKALDNPYFSSSISLVAKQEITRSGIIFNNGLHGFHLEDTTEYKEHYEKQILFLQEEFKETPIALVLTTCVEGKRNERVKTRNNCVKELAEKYRLPLIDLYTVSVENVHLRGQDGIHWTEEGYYKLAQVILDSIYENFTSMNK